MGGKPGGRLAGKDDERINGASTSGAMAEAVGAGELQLIMIPQTIRTQNFWSQVSHGMVRSSGLF